MARNVNETAKTADATKEEQATNTATVEEKAQNGANTEADAVKETVTLVYIGPQLPSGLLKTNTIYRGTREEIKKELEKVFEKYPLAEKMMVPVAELADKKAKAKTKGNIYNKYYTDILSQMAAKEV